MGNDARTPAAGSVSAIVIRAASAADIPEIAGIERQAFSDPWSATSFKEALAHSAVFFATARRSDAADVLGYVVAWFVADEGEIANLAVAPAGWGQGVGRGLLDAALAEGLAREARTMYLEVREGNERARRLYASAGFEEVGRRRGYYRRPVEDAIVLRRTLW